MYRLSEGQRQIVTVAAGVAERHIGPNATRVDKDATFPAESIAALGREGLLGLTIPASFGGRGEGLRTMAATLETVAQHCSSTAMVYLMHLCGVACYTAVPDKTEQVLREAAAGRHLATLAFSEKGSRSHFWAPVSRAGGADGNGAIALNATKSFVTSAGHADGYVVSTLA